VIWLLRIEIAGRTWYLSSMSCAPLRDGVAVPHHGTLEVGGFAEGIEIGGGISGPCTCDVSFHLGDLDGWTLINEGHRLDAGIGEVSLWREGWTYAERVVLIKGPVESDSIPLDGEPFEASIVERVIDLSTPWPDPADTVNTTAWPNAPSDDDDFSVVGLSYPMPIGILGSYLNDDGVAKRTSTTPVIIVDDTGGAEVGCVAGMPVAATVVRIWNSIDHDAADFDVDITVDGEGKQRATVSFAAAPGGWVFDGSEPLYVNDWYLGGITSSRSAISTKGLGDAIVYLMERRYDASGPERIDYGAWAAVAHVLNGQQIGINLEAGDPLDVISGDLMPLCPGLYIMGGPRGLRPVYCEDTPGDRCELLTVGRELDVSDEPPGFVDVEVVNEVSVAFAYSSARSEYRATETIGATKTPEAAASATRFGVRSEALEAKACYDRGTAGAAARETIRLRWTKPIYLVYEASADVALDLVLGRRYRITDEDRGLNERLMWIMARETTDGETWSITFFGLW
jgi:hypothetical protein